MLGGKALCRVQIIVLPLPQSSRACPMTSSMPSIRDAPRANIVKRTTSLPPKHAAEVNVPMNKNLRMKSFSSGHCLVTRPPSVVLNATSSLQNLVSSRSLPPQRELHPNNVVVAQQRHGSRLCLHVEMRSNFSFSMSSPSPRGCHGCYNSASP